MELTDIEKDALTELGNIGASHSASVLSDMIQKSVSISVPKLKFIPINQFPDAMGGEEEIVVGLYSVLSNDIDGTLMFIFKEKDAKNIAEILMGMPRDTIEDLDEMSTSAIQEVGNIMTSAFANALADFLELKVVHAPPGFALDMAGAILSAVMAQLAQDTDEAMIFNTHFIIDQESIFGHMFLSPSSESMSKILNILRTKFGLS